MKVGDPVWALEHVALVDSSGDVWVRDDPSLDDSIDWWVPMSVIPADAWLPALAAVVREVGPEVVATWLSNSATRLEFDGLSIAAGYMRRLAAALEVK